MKAVKSILGTLLLCLLTLQVQASDKQQQIDTILEQSGFNKLLQHVPDFAQAVLKQSSGALEPEINSALSAVFQDAFATDAVRQGVIEVIDAHYDESRANSYIQQLNSPLSRRMAELERTTSNPANAGDFRAFATTLDKTPPPESRSQLIKRLDQANRTTEFSIDMQTAFFKAIFVAIDPVMDADMRLADGELDKMVDEVRNSLDKSLRKNTRLAYLYAFRKVSDKELEGYIEMCESDSYRWAIQMLANAMISALSEAADHAAEAMSAAAHSKK
jgi:hypothetical protein